MTKTENEEIIHLKVKSNDHEEIFFKIKKVTPLKKLMEKYCERMGLSNLNNVRFLFDGERIVPSNTPSQLNMQNGDEIDVYVEQHGGNSMQRLGTRQPNRYQLSNTLFESEKTLDNYTTSNTVFS
jgi:small ubiquitin-related modifier